MSRSKNGRAAETGATKNGNAAQSRTTRTGKGGRTRPNAATRKPKGKRCWCTVVAGGVRVLEAPDGTAYRGTAAEIRDAALYPWLRRTLADKIHIQRQCAESGILTREEAREVIMECRRETIMYNAFAHRDNPHLELSESMRIDVEAAARATGTDEAEFIRRAVAEAVADVRRGCGGELPYTRHERAALAAGGAL